ncbi:hypothetical protein DIPPA_07531 [Diplonema papillatum]|nr:hypothetical protein DIPPA_07531 [Diplonema papillatum]
MGWLENQIADLGRKPSLARNIWGSSPSCGWSRRKSCSSSAANLRTFPKEFEDKFDTIHEAAALKSLPLDQQQPQDEYDSKTADTQTASTVPCPRGVRDVVDTDEEPAAEQPANPRPRPPPSPPANSKVESAQPAAGRTVGTRNQNKDGPVRGGLEVHSDSYRPGWRHGIVRRS